MEVLLGRPFPTAYDTYPGRPPSQVTVFPLTTTRHPLVGGGWAVVEGCRAGTFSARCGHHDHRFN